MLGAELGSSLGGKLMNSGVTPCAVKSVAATPERTFASNVAIIAEGSTPVEGEAVTVEKTE